MNKWYKKNTIQSKHIIMTQHYTPLSLWPDDVIDFFAKYNIGSCMLQEYPINFTSELNIWNDKKNQVDKYGPAIVYEVRDLHDELKVLECRPFPTTLRKYKYLSQGNKLGAIFYSDPSTSYSDNLIITEDILSAIRVREATRIPTISLLGCCINTSKLHKIINYAENYLIWLDGDEPGVKGAMKLKKKLDLFGKSIIISSEKDPKEYNNKFIKTIVQRHLNKLKG